MEYTLIDYRQNDLVKLDVSVNSEPVDALSFILHKDNAYFVGKELCTNLTHSQKYISSCLYPVSILWLLVLRISKEKIKFSKTNTGNYPAAAVQGADPGKDWREDYRLRSAVWCV